MEEICREKTNIADLMCGVFKSGVVMIVFCAISGAISLFDSPKHLIYSNNQYTAR